MRNVSVVRELATEDACAGGAALRSGAIMLSKLNALCEDFPLQDRLEVRRSQSFILIVGQNENNIGLLLARLISIGDDRSQRQNGEWNGEQHYREPLKYHVKVPSCRRAQVEGIGEQL